MIDPKAVPVRHSSLKNMGKSPAHYLEALQTPFESTAAMKLGTAIHSMVLGGSPVIGFEGGRRGKAWEAFESDHPGMIILTTDEHERAIACRDSIAADPNAMRVLEGNYEQVVNWEHGGRACVSTLDVHNPGKWITELKTTISAKPSKFLYQARNLNYDSQLAFYTEAVGGGIPEHFIVAVETAAPFPVTVFRVMPSTIELGRALWHSWFERLRVCEESDDWPAYSRLIEELAFPQEGDGLDWGGEETT